MAIYWPRSRTQTSDQGSRISQFSFNKINIPFIYTCMRLYKEEDFLRCYTGNSRWLELRSLEVLDRSK
jgi:hypothetical protein